ncbi:MAG: hypothetical protein JWL77_7076 [Chthonomonadaceae bacterium]|nr:hypothetical protein [Chthonomonadaceae bacterium]
MSDVNGIDRNSPKAADWFDRMADAGDEMRDEVKP